MTAFREGLLDDLAAFDLLGDLSIEFIIDLAFSCLQQPDLDPAIFIEVQGRAVHCLCADNAFEYGYCLKGSVE